MYLPFCVYILFSHKDQNLYAGFTTNLEARLGDHNNGKTKSTRPRRPLELIYCEFHISKKDALKRERYFKSTKGKRVIRLILRDALSKLKKE